MSVKSMIVGALALFAVSAPAMAQNEIRFGIETSYPPFGDISPKGEIIGYDADIANALCIQMDVKCVLVKEEWDNLIPGLNNNKFDAVVASMSVTADRKKLVDFTDPYYSNKLQFVAAKSEKFDVSQLAGKALGVQADTIAAAWLKENAKGAEIKIFDTQDKAHAALAAGDLYAVLADSFVNWEWLMTPAGKSFEFKGKAVKDDDKIAIAVKKGNGELVAKLNKALKDIVENGEYQLINDRYFPFDIH